MSTTRCLPRLTREYSDICEISYMAGDTLTTNNNYAARLEAIHIDVIRKMMEQTTLVALFVFCAKELSYRNSLFDCYPDFAKNIIQVAQQHRKTGSNDAYATFIEKMDKHVHCDFVYAKSHELNQLAHVRDYINTLSA